MTAKKTASEIILPAEWEAHRATWVGWPSAADLWLENLEPARKEVAEMVKLLVEGEVVKVAVSSDEAMKAAKAMLPASVKLFPLPFGDIWFRDIGPIFATSDMELVALRFRSNGWGGKYILPHDDKIGDHIATAETPEIFHHDFILEGGAIEHDGEGTILTTRQCLLNENRNSWGEKQAEEHLKKALGAQKILWLDEGQVGDHTDGHIDNIARFIGPAKVICQKAAGADDPNAEIYEKIYSDLCKMTDAKGRKLQVIQVPSPGLVENEDGDPIAASHVNFIIGNRSVIVPTYGTPSADEAVREIAKLFPGRKVSGVSSNAIISGGGSFHCMSQQVPA
jgi:agmatine deiminase